MYGFTQVVDSSWAFPRVSTGRQDVMRPGAYAVFRLHAVPPLEPGPCQTSTGGVHAPASHHPAPRCEVAGERRSSGGTPRDAKVKACPAVGGKQRRRWLGLNWS